MRLGILSDSHNHLPETRRALDSLLERGAGHLVHCGDVGEDVLDLLAATCLEHRIRAHVALGNCDRTADSAFAPVPAGIERGPAPEFEFDGRRCLVLHGDRPAIVELRAAQGGFQYLFTGHTHSPAERTVGNTRILNPGSCARSRLGPATVLLLDLATNQAEWVAL